MGVLPPLSGRDGYLPGPGSAGRKSPLSSLDHSVLGGAFPSSLSLMISGQTTSNVSQICRVIARAYIRFMERACSFLAWTRDAVFEPGVHVLASWVSGG